MDLDFATCPFNSEHKVLKFRLPAHIIKCKKNYKGEPMETCVFNATHIVKMGKMQEHLKECTNYIQFNEQSKIPKFST